ncbi:hypothetical protein FA15DRAFT_670956 [Coprinopsis marcescibilis]|uniref:Uncharacterized protein n=1 Tax=Coprinopsis marcescibilis TaxID=230819 RepID=A0A5C3KS51_COPMA|nr:hypothetical protein FA15DRAFT_670956 [Coprinopsis marcescibilis]
MTTQTTPQTQAILHILYALLGISVVLFVISMLFGGVVTLWISPVTTLLAMVYSSTVLVLNYKRRNDAASFPTVERIPAIFFPFFFAVAYLAAICVAIVVVVHIAAQLEGTADSLGVSLPDSARSGYIVCGFAIAEIVLMVVQVGLLTSVGALGLKERKAATTRGLGATKA